MILFHLWQREWTPSIRYEHFFVKSSVLELGTMKRIFEQFAENNTTQVTDFCSHIVQNVEHLSLPNPMLCQLVLTSCMLRLHNTTHDPNRVDFHFELFPWKLKKNLIVVFVRFIRGLGCITWNVVTSCRLSIMCMSQNVPVNKSRCSWGQLYSLEMEVQARH